MIDRTGRDSLALHLRRLASGRITNDEFDAIQITSSLDAALPAVWEAGWGLYHDFTSYRLRGASSLKPDALRAVGRCVLFLGTDLPYEWPPRRPSLNGLLLAVLTLGAWRRRQFAAWKASGPFELWPFFRNQDYQNALAAPRFLVGAGPEQAA